MAITSDASPKWNAGSASNESQVNSVRSIWKQPPRAQSWRRPCDWRTPPGTPCRLCQSRLGEPFALRQMAQPVDRTRQSHEGAFLPLARKFELMRMIRPRGTPAFREAASSHSANSSGRRTVIVLLICLNCDTLLVGLDPVMSGLQMALSRLSRSAKTNPADAPPLSARAHD